MVDILKMKPIPEKEEKKGLLKKIKEKIKPEKEPIKKDVKKMHFGEEQPKVPKAEDWKPLEPIKTTGVKPPEDLEKDLGISIGKEGVFRKIIGLFNPFYWIDRISGFTVNVWIFKKTMFGVEKIRDKGRLVLDFKDGIENRLLKLKKNNISLPIPPSKYFMYEKGKPTILLGSNTERDFFPMKIKLNNPDPEIEIVPENVRLWHSFAVRKAVERFKRQGTLEKLLPVILVVGTALSLGMMFYLAGQGMVAFSGEMSGAASGITSAAGKLAEAVEKLGAIGG